jgi:hypothetical protein
VDAATAFSITVPDTWFEVDLHPATRKQSIDALVRARTRGIPELYEQRGTIAKLLRDAAREASSSGAVFCAVMVEAVEGAGLTASVTVSLVPSPVEGSAPTTVPAIMAKLSEKQATSATDTWVKVAIVDVPDVGQVARSYGVEDINMPGGAGWIRATTMQTFVPVPGSPHVVLVACSSPNTVLVDALHDLFDAISGTFRFRTGSTT